MIRRAIALIGEDNGVRSELQRLLARDDLDVAAIANGMIDVCSSCGIELYIVQNATNNFSYAMEMVRKARMAHPRTPVVLLAWTSSEELAIAAIKEGVVDYFASPIELGAVAAAVRRITNGPASRTADDAVDIIGQSPAMCDLRSYIKRVAQRDCNALLLGETGTGKDLVAAAIHANSPRCAKPFICVNCAAIPDSLLESELFGYEKGAFTGAHGAAEGKIRQAHEGTIFFDEIGEMTPYAQAKILKVIEVKQIQRLGGKANVSVNVRIIAATNQDLPKLVAEQRFRKDLYFRLNVAQIQLPALRDRRADIRMLLEYYVEIFNRQTGSSLAGFTPQALSRLVEYDWPGNVRELRNVVESIFVDPPFPRIDVCHLPFLSGSFPMTSPDPNERDLLLEALEATRWNKSKAAAKLNWSRMKIYRKMAKYQIGDPETLEHAEAPTCR
ncbi:MAG TPA: sigma-54 dependent transcriptional regulator [Bryobacteraceae bacterium]|nr:sigma-54 dependent transcriptional regulator [Bryobacteraceae bacterium]